MISFTVIATVPSEISLSDTLFLSVLKKIEFGRLRRFDTHF